MPLRLSRRFAEQYARLPATIRRKVAKALDLLEADFRHPGLRSHPVKGFPGVFEAYVDSKYRLTFERQGQWLILHNVDNHDDCLNNP